MSRQSDKISSAANQGSRERDMVAIVAALARELHPQRSRFIEVGASSRIERDLGIDSLARTELVLRLERAFRVRLHAQAIGEAETVHDLAQALDRPSLRNSELTLKRQLRLCRPSRRRPKR